MFIGTASQQEKDIPSSAFYSPSLAFSKWQHRNMDCSIPVPSSNQCLESELGEEMTEA